jgi:hypothetical protein
MTTEIRRARRESKIRTLWVAVGGVSRVAVGGGRVCVWRHWYVRQKGVRGLHLCWGRCCTSHAARTMSNHNND